MKEHPYRDREDREGMQELLDQFEDLRSGRHHAFIEEDAFEKIIEYYQEQEDLTRAMEAAELGHERYPYSSLLLIKKADILLANRKYQESLDVLEQASLLDGGDINLYILKTDAYLALDQQEKAVALLQEALALFEGEEKTELLFELADVYDDYEDFEKVFDCLRTILEDDPINEEALYKICFWTDFTGRNEESIRLHEKIINEYPYCELAWFNLAAAYQGLKLYEKAIDAYQYAITIDEKFDYAYRNMGDAYIRLRKYREAIEALEKVAELAKPEDVIFEAIGHCYDKLKNFANARFYYRKASHLRQDDAKLFYKVACTYYNEQNWQSCIRQLDHALKYQRDQYEYLLLAGESHMHLEQYREALQYLGTVVKVRPRNRGGWEALIRCLYKAGMTEEALRQNELALEITNGNALFYFYKAAILLEKGDTKEGLLQLENAMEKTPRLLKRFIELNPAILQNQQVVELVARYKRRRSF